MEDVIKLQGLNEQQRKIISGNGEACIAELEHAPKNVNEAIQQLFELDAINRRIKEGYYRDHFFLVAGAPKSGSSSLASAVSSMLGTYEDTSAPWPLVVGNYMLGNVSSDLRAEMLLGLPPKAIMKHHPRASGSNIKCLDLLGCRYVIGVRHPADQLTALYCHYRDPQSGGKYDAEKKFAYDHISPFQAAYLWHPDDMEKFFSHLINDGYLESLCKWMSDWVHFRNPERSQIIRFEDFFDGTGSGIADVFKFLHKDSVVPEQLQEHAHNVSRQLNEHMIGIRKNKTTNTQRYPHGFTGDIGAYATYFSKQNMIDYNKVIETILSSSSMKQGLHELYTDLLLPL